MNVDVLKQAEANILQQFPGGFSHPDMVAIGKKHPVDKLSEQAKKVLGKAQFKNQGQVLEDLTKLVSRSSMVSMFEKPKFRDYVNGLDLDDRACLANGFRKMLHGTQRIGFNEVLNILSTGKLARWSLISICPHHYRPNKDVFVKPTTTKGVIKLFELDLTYNPRPSWEFYEAYREAILQMKSRVDPSLAPNNAAFTGFLMMSLQHL